MLLSSRREECGHDYPGIWPVTRPGFSSRFRLRTTVPEDTTVRAVSRSRGMIALNGVKYPLNVDIRVNAGSCDAEVHLDDAKHFPCFFIAEGPLATGENWTCDAYDTDVRAAQCDPAFESPDDDRMVIATPFPKAPRSFYYNQKVNCLPATGTVRVDFGMTKKLNYSASTVSIGRAVIEAISPTSIPLAFIFRAIV